MLHLQTEHLIVKDVLLNRFKSAKEVTVDLKVCDFDDAQYHITVAENILTYSISVKGTSTILAVPEYKAAFDDYFGQYVDANTDPAHDLTLVLNLESLPASDEGKEELALLFSRVKRYIIGAPLIAMGRALDKKAPLTESVAVEVRYGEYVYYIPRQDRITVVFDVSFKDPTDVAIAKVFLQEFNEMKRYKELATAPNALFSATPLLDLTESPKLNATIKENKSRLGFLAFAVQPRHVEAKTLDNTIDRMVQFRAYLHYHIKCSKSQMHTRMRKQVELLLQVLNRAIPDVPKDKASGGPRFVVSGGGAAGL